LSRRPEDHRRHRRGACGDCQGYSRTWACLCAPPRSPAPAAGAVPGGPDPQGKSGSAMPWRFRAARARV